jgi:hypothetical protein
MLWKYALAGFAGAALLNAQNVGTSDPAVGILRPQVAAGIIPQASITQAQEAAADAQDAELLARMLGVGDLTEEQAVKLQEAAARRVDRATATLQKAQRLVDAGLIPAQSLKEPSQAQAWAQSDAETARARAALVREVGEMARVEALIIETPLVKPNESLNGDRPAMERFDGNGTFTRSEFNQIKLAFEKQFGKPLPVSADGSTAVHRALGFDHSNRVDVALVPDTPEGVWLRHYLELSAIPYYAFRTFIAGKATAAHIHIGLPSNHVSTGAGIMPPVQERPRS